MQLQKQMINGRIIFDNHTKKFMTKKEMIKFAESFWEQGMRDDERKEIEEPLKEECEKWNDNFKEEYLKMKIDYLFSQFNEFMWDCKNSKAITPFDVWDASDEETWELADIPQQMFGIWIDNDGEEKIKRLKQMIKWHKKEK